MERREFIEYSIKGMAGLALSSTLLNTIACSKNISAKPNILVIVSDDTGWNDVGYHNSEIITPNIDKLAGVGVELNQFYVSPVCSPTRAALLTGRHPSRFGILGPIASGSKKTIPMDITTLPEFLKQNGYKTAITGKWHLGLRPEDGPRKHGFDYSYGYLHGQIDPYTHLYKNGEKSWHRNDILFDEEGHVTDLITKEAVKYIQNSNDSKSPFFLYVPYSAPHFPIKEEKKWLDLYPNIKNESRRKFMASMTHMDDGIGKILQSLEDNNLTENTLIIYLSDNGAQKKWDSGPRYYGNKFPPADVLGDNTPLNGWKAGLYEGGIRTPALFYWKNKLKPARVDEVTAIEDIYPTIAQMIGAELPKENLEGIKIAETFNGEKLSSRLLYWRTDKQIAVRKGNWKLVNIGKTLAGSKKELYNLSDDPYEKNDLMESEPEIADELMCELIKQMELDSN